MKDWCRVRAVCVVSYHNLLGLCNKARRKVSLSQVKLPVCICWAEMLLGCGVGRLAEPGHAGHSMLEVCFLQHG